MVIKNGLNLSMLYFPLFVYFSTSKYGFKLFNSSHKRNNNYEILLWLKV